MPPEERDGLTDAVRRLGDPERPVEHRGREVRRRPKQDLSAVVDDADVEPGRLRGRPLGTDRSSMDRPEQGEGCGDAVGRGLHGTHPTAPSPAGDGRSARLPDVRDDDLYSLPEGLPVPIDDGGCDHLPGRVMPPVALPATDGSTVRLDAPVPGWTIVFAYPRTGEPDADPPGGLAAWDAIPGARGCTPQACAYRDHHAELVTAGARVFGLSTQDTAYQHEMAERLHLPFPVLSDEGLALTRGARSSRRSSTPA